MSTTPCADCGRPHAHDALCVTEAGLICAQCLPKPRPACTSDLQLAFALGALVAIVPFFVQFEPNAARMHETFAMLCYFDIAALGCGIIGTVMGAILVMATVRGMLAHRFAMHAASAILIMGVVNLLVGSVGHNL